MMYNYYINKYKEGTFMKKRAKQIISILLVIAFVGTFILSAVLSAIK